MLVLWFLMNYIYFIKKMFSKIKGMTNKMAHIVEKLKDLPQAEDFLNPYVGDEEYDRVILYKMDLYVLSKELDQLSLISWKMGNIDLWRNFSLILTPYGRIVNTIIRMTHRYIKILDIWSSWLVHLNYK